MIEIARAHRCASPKVRGGVDGPTRGASAPAGRSADRGGGLLTEARTAEPRLAVTAPALSGSHGSGPLARGRVPSPLDELVGQVVAEVAEGIARGVPLDLALRNAGVGHLPPQYRAVIGAILKQCGLSKRLPSAKG